jgi:3-oxoacyl-[acyl-carrier-protein] synthase II
VVITGIGVVSPVGCTHDKFCPALVDGRSGIREISIAPTKRLVTRIAPETTDFKPEDYFTARQSMSNSFAFGGLNAVLVFARA